MHRLQRIVDRLDIRPTDRVLEIGCGLFTPSRAGRERQFETPRDQAGSARRAKATTGLRP